MADMFLNTNIRPVNQPQIKPANTEKEGVQKGLDNFWGPLVNFFETTPDAIPTDLPSEINKISAEVAKYEKMQERVMGESLHYMS